MKRFSIAVVVATVAALASPLTAAADPAADVWTVMGHGEAPAPAGDPLQVAIDAVVGAANATTGTCTPKTAENTAYSLGFYWLVNGTTNESVYIWEGPGSATVSSDCAGDVRVSVQVSDYAPGGSPAVVRGNVAPATDDTATAGRFTAHAQSKAWVPYYRPLSGYQRGNSLVEIKVNGSYYNRKARAYLPIPCVATYTPVTPTPVGPILGEPTQPQPCQ